MLVEQTLKPQETTIYQYLHISDMLTNETETKFPPKEAKLLSDSLKSTLP